MKIEVKAIEGEEYYLEDGAFKHICQDIPPRHGCVICKVCGAEVVDDYDYYDEYRDLQSSNQWEGSMHESIFEQT